jgi:hypothetical protein
MLAAGVRRAVRRVMVGGVRRAARRAAEVRWEVHRAAGIWVRQCVGLRVAGVSQEVFPNEGGGGQA